MNRDQLDQEGSQENRPKGRQRRKGERNRPDMVPGESKVNQSGEGSRRDQLDDQGRQQHMGHGEESAEQPRSPGVEEEPGRPVWVDQGSAHERRPGRKEPPGEWDDKTEGTSREESGPAR